MKKPLEKTTNLQKIKTSDGSYTFYSSEYDENYHSLIGAFTESLNKFIIPSQILEQSHQTVLDIGFGLGYNSFSLIEQAKKNNLFYKIIAFEKDCSVLKSSLNLHPAIHKKILKSLLEKQKYITPHVHIQIYFGDARENIAKILPQSINCIFLDPFSPPKNTELWTINFFKKLYKKLKIDGKILTYSSALPVISAFIKAGFYVGYTPAIGRKRGGLLASKNSQSIQLPLTDHDLYLLSVSANAIPNIDKHNWDKQTIKKYREKLVNWAKGHKIKLSHKSSLKISTKKY